MPAIDYSIADEAGFCSELMNAASQPKALALANKIKGTGKPVRWTRKGGAPLNLNVLVSSLQKGLIRMTSERRFRLVCLGLAFFFSCITFQAVNAASTPEQVLENFNSASTYEEAIKYLTGRMKTQLAGLNGETREKVLKTGRMKHYQALTLPGNGDRHVVIVTNVIFIDEKQTPMRESSLIYEFVIVDDQWKIEWRRSGSTLIELFTQKFSPVRFHSQNSFQFDGKPIKMESAFAFYDMDKRNEENTWIHIRFYPFKFQERDIEFLKYNSGPSVEDRDKPTAIASSLKYPVIRLDIQTDTNNKPSALSFGWDSFDGATNRSTALNPPLQTAGLKRLVVSKKLLTLILEGSAQSTEAVVNRWNINTIELPLLKKGL